MHASSLGTLLIILAVVVYMIVRQVTEQPVRPLSLLILPILVLYDTYVVAADELAKPIANLGLLLALMLVGLGLGATIGLFRSHDMRIRQDAATGTVYVKRGTIGIAIWFAILLVRIGAETLFYLGVTHRSVPAALFLALAAPLFLGNIVMGQLMIYLRSSADLSRALTMPRV